MDSATFRLAIGRELRLARGARGRMSVALACRVPLRQLMAIEGGRTSLRSMLVHGPDLAEVYGVNWIALLKAASLAATGPNGADTAKEAA